MKGQGGVCITRLKSLAGMVLILTLCLAFAAQPIKAQGGQALPAVPDKAILDKITQAGVPAGTPLGLPAPIANQFLAMAMMVNNQLRFSGNDLTPGKFFDLPRAVFFANPDGGFKSVFVPMLNLADTKLASNMKTSDGTAALALGGAFDFGKGGMVPKLLVVAWKDSSAATPSELRVYSLATAATGFATPYKMLLRKLKGAKDGKPAPGDQGIVVAGRETCITVGLDQVCFTSDQTDKQADPKAASAVGDAVTALSKAYTFTSKIDVDGAMSGIAGTEARTQCAAKLQAATGVLAIATIPECAVTIAFAGVSEIQAGQPVGAIHLFKDVIQPAFDLQGNSVAKLPAGDYVIVDATPTVTDPGAAGVLMFVGSDGKSNFLVPGQVIEGFGDSGGKDANARNGQAGVKDAVGAIVGTHAF